MNEIDYTQKICISEDYLGVFVEEKDIEKINQDGIIAIMPAMGDFSAPEIVLTISSFMLDSIVAGLFYDAIKRLFNYLKNKFRKKKKGPKPVLVLRISNYKDFSADISVDLDNDNCDEALERVKKIVDAIKD